MLKKISYFLERVIIIVTKINLRKMIILMISIREKKLKKLQAKIAVGTEQIANGKLTDGEQVFARLQEKINRRKES